MTYYYGAIYSRVINSCNCKPYLLFACMNSCPQNCLLQQNLIKVVLLSTLLSTMIANQGNILMQLFIKLMHLTQSLWKLSYQITKNMVSGCIYKHPPMQITDFHQNYLCPLIDKLINMLSYWEIST